MTLDDGFDRTVSDWLDQEAGRGAPGYLDEILTRTTRTRQRPAWSSLERGLPMDLTDRRPLLASRLPWRPILLLAALAVVIAAALLVFAGSQPRLPEPFGIARNGSLLYAAKGDIYRVEPATGVVSVLVAGSADDSAPAYSRDGTQFAFIRYDGPTRSSVMLARADGGDIRSATGPLAGLELFAWSPDGTRLVALHRAESGMPAISIVQRASGGALRSLSLGYVAPVAWVDWRPPDGRELIFEGHPKFGSNDVGIYAIGPDGTGLHAIAPALPDGPAYGSPRLSPDGARLAYWRWEPSEVTGNTDGWTRVIELGTGVDTQMRYSNLAAEVNAVFSPDGSQVLVERQAAVAPYPAQMLVVLADGSAAGVAIGPTFAYDSPHAFGFSPDGQQVVLAVDGSPTRFYRISDGAAVPGPDELVAYPSWQRLRP